MSLTSVEGKNLIEMFIIVIIITIGDYNKESIKLPNRALHDITNINQIKYIPIMNTYDDESFLDTLSKKES